MISPTSSVYHRKDDRLFLVAVRSLPAVLGNIEDHAVWILELAFKVAVAFVAEIEEEFAAVGFDAPLGFGKIIDLKPEVVRADKAARFL